MWAKNGWVKICGEENKGKKKYRINWELTINWKWEGKIGWNN